MGLSRVGGGTAWTPTLSSSPVEFLAAGHAEWRFGHAASWQHRLLAPCNHNFQQNPRGMLEDVSNLWWTRAGAWTWEPCQLKSTLFKHAMLMRSLSKSGFALRLRLDPSKVGYFALWGGQHLSLPQTVSDAPGKGPERWLAIDVWTPLTYYKIYEGRASDRWPDPPVSGPSSGMQRHAK